MNKRKKSLKILVAASTYPRWKHDTVPMFVYDQLLFLKKNFQDIQIIVLAPHDAGASIVEQEVFGVVHRFKYFWPSSLQKIVYPAILPNLAHNPILYLQVPFLFFFEFFALLYLAIKERPDFIYSHWFIPQGVVGGVVSKLTRIPHVYTSHSSDVAIARKLSFLGTWVVQYFTKSAYRITVVSQRSYEKLKSFFSEKQWAAVDYKIRIIPMGVDSETFQCSELNVSALKNEYQLADKIVIFFIGRLVEKKGVSYLLEAFQKISERFPKAVLVIAGDGPLMPSLQAQARELKVAESVLFVGYLVDKKKMDYFSLADILVIPSIITDSGDAEGLPVALLEGLAAGKICIATDVSGADNVLENTKDGFLVPQKSPESIVNAVEHVLTLPDRQKIDLSACSLNKSRLFQWDVIVQQYYRHFFDEAEVGV